MRSMCAAAGVVACFAGVSSASIVLVSDVREVRAAASVSSPNGSDSDGPNSAAPTAFGADFNGSALANAVVIGAGAGASTVQVSTIDAMTINAQGSVSLSSSVGQGGMGTAMGRSLVDLVFDVPGGTSIELIAARSGIGVIELRDGQDNVLFEGSGIFRTSWAGRLHLLAYADATLSTPPSGSTGGGYSLILNAVPSPGAGLLLGSGGVLLLRRRR